MVFGRKKKRQKSIKREGGKEEISSGKVRRRPSYVSSPLKGRKAVKHKKSISKGKLQRGKIKTVSLHHSVRRKSQRNAVPNIPPPPDPPAYPGQMKSKLTSPSSQRRKSSEAKPNKTKHPISAETLTQTMGRKCQLLQQNMATAAIQSEEKPVRERTRDDLVKWLQWRMGVNEQLVSYVFSESKENVDSAPMSSRFPSDFTAGNIDAIINHSFNREQPQTSLDKLSYMIYGIPRIQSQHHVVTQADIHAHQSTDGHQAGNLETLDQVSTYVTHLPSRQNSKASNKLPQRTDSNVSAGRLPRRQIKGNLFIQTSPLSNIPRYLPQPSTENYSSPNNLPNVHYRKRANVSRVPSRISAMGPISAHSTHSRPPIAGAVPTLLSGLPPYQPHNFPYDQQYNN